MKLNEYMMVIAMEECAEVQQEFSKILRFGPDDTDPNFPDITNERALLTEFYQLCAVVEDLQQSGILATLSPDEIHKIKDQKMKKVRRFAQYSIENGYLEKVHNNSET